MKELFENILSKRLQEHIKPFPNVEVGDRGEDYNGEAGEVIAKGAAKDLLDYDSSGALKDGMSEGYIDDDEECVAIKDSDGGIYTYTYGGDGFWVEDKEYKDFKEIEIGDEGTDYNNSKVIILGKGSANRMMSWGYDKTGAIRDGVDEGSIDLYEHCVYVKDLETGEKCSFVYGPSGVTVAK